LTSCWKDREKGMVQMSSAGQGRFYDVLGMPYAGD
jgi:hypothetical protein